MKRNKFCLNLIMLMTILMAFASCGSSSSDSTTEKGYYVATEEYYGELVSEEIGFNSEDSDTYKRENKFEKEGIVENTSLVYDESLEEVFLVVDKFDGYFVETSSSQNSPKNFSGTIKVPVENFDGLMNELVNVGVNTNYSSSVINKTEGYYSLKSQIEVKKLSLERLKALIDSATEPEEVLNLYKNYYDLLTEIEIMEKQLSDLEYVTSQSTIYYQLYEDTGLQIVKVPTEGFFKKIAIGINQSATNTVNLLENIFIFMAYISVPLILIVIILILFLPIILKQFRKFKNNKKEEKNKIIPLWNSNSEKLKNEVDIEDELEK